jgi:uncharacterized phiE125 gp8 family phage protein
VATDDRGFSSALAAGLIAVRLVRVTEPAAEPITAAEAKLWLKVDHDEDDTLITELIKAARSIFEQMTGRTLIDTTYRAEWDELPRVGTYIGAAAARELELPRSPFKASSPVSWVKYLNTSGVETTFDAANYTVETGRATDFFPRVRLVESADWPELGDYPAALRCQFSAGYGAAATDVPDEIKVCLKLLLSHLYQNRMPLAIGNIVNELPWSLSSLVDLHRIRGLV